MIALIPARGGSKRLPNKNIKLLNGKPLIAYTIEAALQAKEISRVIVSTHFAYEENRVIDNFVVLQPTSPLRTNKHIDEAIALFKKKQAKAVVSYCKEFHSIFWHKKIDSKGKVINIFEGDFSKNRQEIEETYFPNGAIYVFDKNYIFKAIDYSTDCYAYIMDRKDSIDIDTIDDFEYAEFLMNLEKTRLSYK